MPRTAFENLKVAARRDRSAIFAPMRWVRATFGEAVSSRTSPAVADDSSPPRIKRSPSRTDSSGHKWPRAAVAPQLRVSHADEMQQELRHGSTLRRKVCALRMLSPFGAYMTEKELERLAKACAFCNIRLGAELTDSPFYVLICGRVAVKRASDEDVICTKQQGAFFTRRVGMGQVGQRSELSISTRLVGAADRSKVLLVTSSHMLGQFYSEVSTLGREAFVDVCASNIGTQLNEVPFIKEARLMPRDLVQLGELCSYLAVIAPACLSTDLHSWQPGRHHAMSVLLRSLPARASSRRATRRPASTSSSRARSPASSTRTRFPSRTTPMPTARCTRACDVAARPLGLQRWCTTRGRASTGWRPRRRRCCSSSRARTFVHSSPQALGCTSR